jgi:hypothetical protein
LIAATPLLTQDEHALFNELRIDRLGDRVRLEQERISYAWLRRALHQLDAAGGVHAEHV